MASQAGNLEVRIDVNAGEDPEEIADATSRLRRRLLELDDARVDAVSAGEAPPGAKAGDLVEIGQLVVQLAQGAAALTTLVGAVQSWMSARRRSGVVKLAIGEDSVEISGDLSPDQQRVVEAWLRRHVST